MAGMIVCIAGERKVVSGGHLYHIKPGVMLFFSPFIPFIEIAREKSYQEVAVTDTLDVFYESVTQIFSTTLGAHLRTNTCLMLTPVQVNFFIAQSRHLKQKICELELAGSEEEKKILVLNIKLLKQSMMLEFMHIHFKTQVVSPEKMGRSEVAVFKFLLSLHQHHKQERSVNHYAAEASLSLGHFSRLVKAQTGKSPSQWIAEATIISAKLLLEQKELSVKQVAKELNFPEQYSFGKYFKLYTGLSPSEYRKQK